MIYSLNQNGDKLGIDVLKSRVVLNLFLISTFLRTLHFMRGLDPRNEAIDIRENVVFCSLSAEKESKR